MNRGKLVAIGAGAAVVVLGMMAAFFFMRGRNVTHAITGGWYLESTNGPVLVVDHGSFWQANSNTSSSYGRPSSRSATRLYSHRVSDGAYLGQYPMSGDARVAGMHGDKLWICDKRSGPVLLQVPDLRVVANRKTIRDAAGTDFELTGSDCTVHPYEGKLEIRESDGKDYWVTTDLRVEPEDPDERIPPPGYYCHIGQTDLIQPHVISCLPPESAPATVLAKSKTSALRKDKKLPPLISGISSSFDKTEVLWTKPMDELVGAPVPDVRWMREQVLDPHRVVLMMGTHEKMLQVHLIFIDPTDGTVLDHKLLFADAAPGPA